MPIDAPLTVALLGHDESTEALACAAIERGLSVVAAFAIPPDARPELAALLGKAPFRAVDEFSLEVADVVIVARGTSATDRLEALRLLFQAGVPLIVSHPVIGSMLDAHELDMIRQSSGVVVVPHLPEIHTSLADLRNELAKPNGGSLGLGRQWMIERRVEPPGRAAVLAALAHDAAWLQWVIGRVTRVSALASRDDLADLHVQMIAGEHGSARWSVQPSADEGVSTVSVAGASGRARVDLPPLGERSANAEAIVGSTRSLSAADETWDQLESALAGDPVEPDWLDMAHALEIADAVERSLARGRTVDLFLDEQTEQGTFKGMMAAGGCLLLLLGLLIVVLGTTLTKFNVPGARFWPWALLVLLGTFLTLQLLRLAFVQDAGDAEPAATENPLKPGERP